MPEDAGSTLQKCPTLNNTVDNENLRVYCTDYTLLTTSINFMKLIEKC